MQIVCHRRPRNCAKQCPPGGSPRGDLGKWQFGASISLLPTGLYIAVAHASIAQRDEKGGFVRKLVLKMSASVGGFVGGPNGWMLDTLWDAGVHMMGSRTFRDMMCRGYRAQGVRRRGADWRCRHLSDRIDHETDRRRGRHAADRGRRHGARRPRGALDT